ncbi:MAG: hypothetical protein EHM43_00865 [Ignavibacteriae bacterium]|nr:MAG: hypothetical protein EHM43_00865 [Ignavibacteriota bacterium]
MRTVAIIMLCALGLATHQLPILWTAYQTVNADYALRHCVNKGTSCHGSCTMKRAYVASDSTSQRRSLPTAVSNELRDLSPYVVCLMSSVVLRPSSIEQLSCALPSFDATWCLPPPFSPPRG